MAKQVANCRKLSASKLAPISILLLLSLLFITKSYQQTANNNNNGQQVDSGLQESPSTQILETIIPQTTNDLDGANLVLASEPFDYRASMPIITKRELGLAIKFAHSNVSKLRNSLEPELIEVAPTLNVMELGSSGWLANTLMHKASLDVRLLNQTELALTSEEATRQLARQYKLNWLQISRGLPLISVDQTAQLGSATCNKPVRSIACMAGQYRSLSGHCNNVMQPEWGAARTPLIRFAHARYSDHVAKPLKSARHSLKVKSMAFSTLPSSRAISIAIREMASPNANANANANSNNAASVKQHAHLTSLLAFTGQLIGHDLMQTSQYTMATGPWTQIKCCKQQQANNVAVAQHPECLPIELNSYCLDYVRSLPASRAGCNLGPRDQLNLVSSFLDASWLYGSSDEQCKRLRAFVGGRLRSTGSPRELTGELLPLIKLTQNNPTAATSIGTAVEPEYHLFATDHQAGGVNRQNFDSTWLQTNEECQIMAQLRAHLRLERDTATSQPIAKIRSLESNCFESGDSRVNENIGLTVLQTIWLREHNLIADKLKNINKHWQDERLFQEARRILIAQFQHVTYTEFLPALLGHDLMQRFNLTANSLQGYSQAYDPAVQAGTSNEFAVTFGGLIRSIIPGHLEKFGDRLEPIGSTQTLDTFMNGAELFKSKRFAQYLTGMISQNAMEPNQGLMSMTSNKMAMLDLDNEISKMVAFKQQFNNNTQTNNKLTNNNNNNNSNNNEDQANEPRVDMIALAIQQARDHGLRGYLYWREACQLKPLVRTWQDLEQVLPAGSVDKLSQVYLSPLQLDLYIAQLEIPLAGAAVGPTLACIFARQFYQLKHGDRYWYENDLPTGRGSFTPAQLDEIRQTSLSKILCRNGQSALSFIQPQPMLASDPYLNAYQYCSIKAMAGLDLSKWAESFHSANQVFEEQLMNNLSAKENAALSDGESAVSTIAQPLAALESAGSSLTAGSDPLSQEPPSLESNGGTGRWQKRSLARFQSFISPQQVRKKLIRARRQLEDLAYAETRRMRAMREAGHQPRGHAHAGYRYLGRPKRQTLQVNNQSLIFELATNDLIRSLVHQGKDREQSQSLQTDIREFLLSLEAIQLDNLLENSNDLAKLQDLVSTAGAGFLTREQRFKLAQANDSTFAADPALDSALGLTSSPSSVNNDPQCQDDERLYPCDHTTPFRTITGYCNNLDEPKYGQSFTQHDRLLPNAYEDGLSQARAYSVKLAAGSSASKIALPSPRLISSRIHDDQSRVHSRYSLALMQFGQFAVDHDLTRTPFAVAIDGSIFDCSACNSRETIHRDCMPIQIPDSDAHFHSARANEELGKKKRCLHFIRSLNGQTGLGPRQQLNALTSYLDASEIYGSDNCEAKSLRLFQGGKLNSTTYFKPLAPITSQKPATLSTDKLKELMPVTRANAECVTPNGFCFHAGDQRASEQPGLTAIHTIFMRYHNYIVGQLAKENRHWNDERLYQQGRRLMGAVMQRIIYNEFLPRLLGLDLMSKHDLLLRETGYSRDYDPSCSASTLSEFSAAAFRMGHSLIRPAFPLLDASFKQIGKSFQLRKAFFNSHRFLHEPTLIDTILRGIVTTPIETLDNSISEELTNHLFEKPNEPFSGMDLVSLNIQRARDHGIAGYNKYRVKCNLTRARNFPDLSNEIPADLITRLQSVYAHVDDIDLFTGGMSELPVHGGLIGPTFGCIIGLQFERLKRCDRFWHETDDPWVRFSPAQLAEIRKSLLSKVICSQSDTIDMIQRNAMDVVTNDNFQ